MSKECGPCSLCQRTSTRYFHTESWDNDKLARFKSHVLPATISLNDHTHICICRACYHDIESKICKENYVPRWKKIKIRKPVEASQCQVEGCTNQGDITTTAISIDNVPEGVRVLGRPSKFCSFHYHLIYNYQHQAVCSSCGTRAKAGEIFRYCPNPSMIEKYLRATSEFNSILREEDKVCCKCYTKFMEIINIHKTLIALNQEANTVDPQVSKDADLDELVADLKQKAQSLHRGSESQQQLLWLLKPYDTKKQ